MTWTRCLTLACGPCCPTLTSHISSAGHVCAGPKGKSHLSRDSLSDVKFGHVKVILLPNDFPNSLWSVERQQARRLRVDTLLFELFYGEQGAGRSLLPHCVLFALRVKWIIECLLSRPSRVPYAGRVLPRVSSPLINSGQSGISLGLCPGVGNVSELHGIWRLKRLKPLDPVFILYTMRLQCFCSSYTDIYF